MKVFFLTLKMNIELFPYNVNGMSCNKLMKLFKWYREYILKDLGPVDRSVLYNQEDTDLLLYDKEMILVSSIVDVVKPVFIVIVF